MTRGTILMVGQQNRETTLFKTRLEKEGYAVALLPEGPRVLKWLGPEYAQVVLCSESCQRSFVDRLVRSLARSRKQQHTPVLLFGQEKRQGKWELPDGVGEILRLHEISLAAAMRRIKLAIKLCQLARTLHEQ